MNLQEPRDIILAMREKWLNLILDGKKVFEVRRTCPKRKPGRIYLYRLGMIWGVADVGMWWRVCDMFNREYFTAGEFREKFAAKACLGVQEYLGYLDGAKRPAVYHLREVYPYAQPIPVSCRPQSWQYMTDEIREQIAQAVNQEQKELPL